MLPLANVTVLRSSSVNRLQETATIVRFSMWQPMPHFICVVWFILLCFPSRYYGQPGLPPSLSPLPSPAESPSDQSDYSSPPTLTPSELAAVYDVWKGVNGEIDWPSYYSDPCYGPTGITCDLINDTYYVTSLHLGSMSVDSTNILCGDSASIHSSLFELVHLTSLQFVGCFVKASVSLSSGFAKLSSLRILSFQNNPALVGQLPPEIGSITSLERLILLHNRFQGRLPTELGNLTNLFQLELYSNRFVGELPSTLGNLRNLVLLDCSKNGFEGLIPPELGKLRDLQMLDLGSNNLIGRIPGSLGGLGSLVVMDLSDNNLFGGLPEYFSSLSKLQDLVLSKNSMDTALPLTIWSGLENLVILDLSEAGFTGSIPASLGSLSVVRYMALNDNNFTGEVPASLGDLNQLQKLNMSSNLLNGPLPFSTDFVQRLGKNLAISNNAGLCYPPALEGTLTVLGLEICTTGQLASLSPPPAPRPLLALPVVSNGRQEGVSTVRPAFVVLLIITWLLY